MKRSLLITIAVVSISLLACGKTSEMDQPTQVGQDTVVTTQDEISKETEKIEETYAETTAETESEEKITPAVEIPKYSIKRNQEFGYFVEYGGKIYYRVPTAEAMKEPALFGHYMSTFLGPSEIRCFDPTTGKSEKFCDSLGWGKLRVFKDSLVAWEKDYPNDQEVDALVMIPFDGGSSVILGDYGTEILAMYDNYIIYEDADYDKGEFPVFCYDYEKDTTIELGKLKTVEYISYPGELQQFYADGDDIWFTISAYEGTGHFFSEALLYHADASEAGSLTYQDFDSMDTINGKDISSQYGADFRMEFNRAPAFVIRDGKPLATEGEPGTAGVIYEYGVLMYYDNDGLRNDVAEGYKTFESEEEGTQVHIELSEYVADKIFLIRNEEWRDAENDVGWREAYVRKFTYIVMVDPQTGEETIIDYAATPLE